MTKREKLREQVLEVINNRWKYKVTIQKQLIDVQIKEDGNIDMPIGMFEDTIKDLLKEGVIEHRYTKTSGTWHDIDLYRLAKNPEPAQMKCKSISFADLKVEKCWKIQSWGLEACQDCKYKDKPSCGGKEIREDLIKNGKHGKITRHGLPTTIPTTKGEQNAT